MTEQPRVGQIVTGNPGRDAIHVAIVPVVAPCDLEPCTHVNARGEPDGVDGVGIVDPFLRRTVLKGERFYLFLYPGSVTSLRHVWTHPSFRVAAPEVKS